MTLFPVTVPASLIQSHGLDPDADGWGQEVRHAVGTASGDMYVLSGLRRSVPRGVEEGGQGFTYQLITRHDADGATVATAVIGYEVPGGTPSAISWGKEANLAVLPDGTLALSSRPGNTHLLSPGLDELLAGWRMSAMPWSRDEGSADDPFAASIAVTPAGRLVCLTSENRLGSWGIPLPNLVAVTEPGAVPVLGHKPVLRALATLESSAARQTEEDAHPHIRHGDGPVVRDNRPSPSLAQAMVSLLGGSVHDWHNAFLTRPVPLADDLYVVPVFGRTYRAGSRGQSFAFALLDDHGTVRGRLDGLDLYQDSPYTGENFTVVADPHSARAFHLNRYGLYAWTADGALRAKLPTADAPFKALTHFALLTATPTGDLLLAHRKQHLVMRVPVPADLADLPAAVADALSGVARERTALKKRHSPVNWLWSEDTGAVHHL
ncbi:MULTISPECIES: hypothetical protein [unclassified Kitasatospora]|uniref:hypothetical protein n=1 Tax=unclassified Kitasatospora TaxID=2633591 RepID=UPI00070FDB5D|nr:MULTISPECIES: hypothetical protein [unclassified Kitasatospora]KQV14844.1 aromatic ring-opening dioxygenase LigA [Kitasatospora sp. Root107]KRB68199.1 aromatic ring-opening dioxygenase LigA [Kitasatospora sp. Root187]